MEIQISEEKSLRKWKRLEIVSGKIGKKSLIIKKFSDKSEFDYEENLIDELRNDQQILSLLFTFTTLTTYCIVFEDFVPLNKFKFKDELQALDAVKQISDGVEFLHNRNIVHGSLNQTNIAVLKQHKTRFKISSFKIHKGNSKTKSKQSDVFDLGVLIKNIFDKIEDKLRFKIYEQLLWVDIVEKTSDSDNIPTMKQVKEHPLFYDALKTLNLIVEARKDLEIHSNPAKFNLESKLHNALLEKSDSICTINWITKIDNSVKDELARINPNFSKFKSKPNVLGLIQTIRNLVSCEIKLN